MKTVKKLFSLLLVAVLLVSAIPFQASAISTTQKYVINFFPNEADDNHVQVELTNLTLTADMIPTPVSSGTEFSRWAVGSRTGGAFTMPANGVRTFQDTDFGISEGIKYINVYAVFAHTHKYEDSDTAAKQDPTCLVGGYKTQVCSCGATQPVTLNALGHDFSGKIPAAGYVEAACETAGTEIFKCGRCDATTAAVTIPALGHDWGAWTVTTTPTTDVAGVETRTCQTLGCGKTETRSTAKQAMIVTLRETEGNSADQTVSLVKGNAVGTLPTLADLPGRRFVGWFSQESYGGDQLISGGTYDGLHTVYYARYVDDVNSTATEVTVYARFFSGDVKQTDMYLGKLTVERYSNLLNALNANRNTFINRIFGVYNSNDYEVKDGFYMNVNDNVVTNSTQVVDGNTSVYIRVNAKKSAEAKVLLYVHNKAGEAAVRLYDMPGYVAYNTVNTTAVQNFLKAQTGKTYTVAGMYEQSAWDQLVAGYKADAVTTVTVPSSGTLQIHVVLSNYTSSSSSSAIVDPSSPATGDTIMMTVGIMVLAAAAVVTLMQLRKRKMI